ncbi:MAG: HD domain-containing protein [Bacteroidales bacterium]|nr:HD domain-containing protein [Bacteroidales bacterium]
MNRILNAEIQQYIEKNILLLYQNFDKGHQIDHAENVIAESMLLARNFEVDLNMVYVIAAYHDIGLTKGRELHHLYSGEMLLNDTTLRQWFNENQIQMMKEAVEDHRASNNTEPRSIYGKIVAEADRDISPETIIRRTIQYGLKKYPDRTEEEYFARTINHIREKYGINGYLKLWLNSPKNAEGLEAIRQLLKDENAFQEIFKKLYIKEINR